MRALLLARKSNKVQINAQQRGEGLSLETQDEVARAFSLAQGWTVVDVAGDTVSGRKVKPTERKNLGPWLTDPALISQWDVLVAAKGDRISRERIEYWAELEAWIVAHGKTLVVVERGGVFFPPRHEGDTYNWAGIKSMAGQEWDVIRGRIIQSQCAIMRAGYWVGREPFGYRIEGDKYRKGLVADVTADYVPAILDRAISGDSLRKIAAWLSAQGVATDTGNAVWNEGVVKQVIMNETYSGTHTRKCAECGGTHDITVPALVDMATQRRAQNALKSRVRGTRGGSGGRPSASPAMLVPVCDACKVPMYRSSPSGTHYYYCKTRTVGGERRGCGLMVRCDVADAFADRVLSADDEDEMTVTVTYPAAALESEIERVRRAERSAFEADDMGKVLELRAQRKALEADLATAERERVEEVPTGRKIGRVWAELDPADRRAWLKRRGISVHLGRDAGRIVTPVKAGQLSAIGRMAAEGV
jgi:DNA invertase Pin-like site-specific DNA recombinase